MHQLPSVGQLLTKSKDIVLKRPGFFFAIAAVPALISFVGEVLYAMNPAYGFIYGVLSLLSAIIGIYASMAMIQGLSDEKLTDWQEAYVKSKGYFWTVLWAAILIFIVVVIGLVLLIIPGVYLAVAFSFYLYAAVLDNKKGWDAAAASKDLVKGYWWAVFGRLLALVLVLLAILGILAWVFVFFDSKILYAFYNLAIGILIAPYAVTYSYLIYKDLKGKRGTIK